MTWSFTHQILTRVAKVDLHNDNNSRYPNVDGRNSALDEELQVTNDC